MILKEDNMAELPPHPMTGPIPNIHNLLLDASLNNLAQKLFLILNLI